jgi:hypothetical protein
MEHPIEVLVTMLVASAALVPVLLKLSCESASSRARQGAVVPAKRTSTR